MTNETPYDCSKKKVSMYEETTIIDGLEKILKKIEIGVESFLKKEISSEDLLELFQEYNRHYENAKEKTGKDFLELNKRYQEMYNKVDIGDAYFD